MGCGDQLDLKIVTIYYYTDLIDYNSISSQNPYKFPIKDHPKGVYVRTKSTEMLSQTTISFKKLGLTLSKSTHFFEKQIDDSKLKPIQGDRKIALNMLMMM